jgi:hypothetical protein
MINTLKNALSLNWWWWRLKKTGVYPPPLGDLYKGKKGRG